MNSVQLSGNFDLKTAPSARRQLITKLKMLEKRQSQRELAVDLSKVTAIDSAGLATLVEILFLTRVAGRKLRLEGVSNQIFKAMQMAQLENLFSIRTYREGRIIH